MARKNVSAEDEGVQITTTSITTTSSIDSDLTDTAGDGPGLGGAVSTLANDPLPTTKVNGANLAEMKSTLDDVVKKLSKLVKTPLGPQIFQSRGKHPNSQHLTSHAFTPSILHPAVHLSLGYASIAFAAYSTIHSYYHKEFEASKPGLWIGVLGYFSLQTALWAWKRWVEKGEVYRGRRRRMVKRIETDQIQITTSTTLDAPPLPSITHSPDSRPISPSSSSPNLLSSPASPFNSRASLSSSGKTTAKPLTISTSAAAASDLSDKSKTLISPPPTVSTFIHADPDPSASSRSRRLSLMTPGLGSGSSTGRRGSANIGQGPTYLVNLTLSTTSNNGKSLLSKARIVSGKSVGDFIDAEGKVEEGEVGRWLAKLLSEAGLVGVEGGAEGDSAGLKEE